MKSILISLLLVALLLREPTAARPVPNGEKGHGRTSCPRPPNPNPSKVLGTWPTYSGRKQDQAKDGCRSKRNVIFMVSDGFGTASETMTREFYQYMHYKNNNAVALADINSILPLDSLLIGAVRTKSADAWVTDSAAAATTYACGVKTYNAAIGVDAKGTPIATVLEAAKAQGYTTGLLATSRITHATPAGWSAHVQHRDWEDMIAAQQIGDNVLGRSVDLMVGGGRKFFIPKSQPGSKRKDERNLLDEARSKFNWTTVVQTRAEFDSVPATKEALPLLGVLAKDHMAYTIDRNATAEPSLAEMSQKALSILADATSACDSPGFFIMIEGSRIDHAGHENDIAAHLHDVLAYQETISVVQSFIKQHPNTVMLSTSDHETGGVTKGSQPTNSIGPGIYNWNPAVIAGVKSSIEVLAPRVKALKSAKEGNLKERITEMIKSELGIKDLQEAELMALVEALEGPLPANEDIHPLEWKLAQIVSDRAIVGFTTHAHTGMDVNLYGINARGLAGNVDSVTLAPYVGNYLGIWETVPELTRRLSAQTVKQPGAVQHKRDTRSEMEVSADRYHAGVRNH